MHDINTYMSMGSRCKLPRLTNLAQNTSVCVCVCVRARVRFLYPRPKKPTHIVNCHVGGVKREENIGSSSTCSLLCTTTFKRPRRFTCEYTYILLVHAYNYIRV